MEMLTKLSRCSSSINNQRAQLSSAGWAGTNLT